MKDNNVKIIGGKWKRKNISFNEAKGLRPTLGKVRETFSIGLDKIFTIKIALICLLEQARWDLKRYLEMLTHVHLSKITQVLFKNF